LALVDIDLIKGWYTIYNITIENHTLGKPLYGKSITNGHVIYPLYALPWHWKIVYLYVEKRLIIKSRDFPKYTNIKAFVMFQGNWNAHHKGNYFLLYNGSFHKGIIKHAI
jgi:hypothetical protein